MILVTKTSDQSVRARMRRDNKCVQKVARCPPPPPQPLPERTWYPSTARSRPANQERAPSPTDGTRTPDPSQGHRARSGGSRGTETAGGIGSAAKAWPPCLFIVLYWFVGQDGKRGCAVSARGGGRGGGWRGSVRVPLKKSISG